MFSNDAVWKYAQHTREGSNSIFVCVLANCGVKYFIYVLHCRFDHDLDLSICGYVMST